MSCEYGRVLFQKRNRAPSAFRAMSHEHDVASLVPAEHLRCGRSFRVITVLKPAWIGTGPGHMESTVCLTFGETQCQIAHPIILSCLWIVPRHRCVPEINTAFYNL
jgi:hypothetical protein